MHRNLDRRVEAIVAITHADHIAQISELFDLAFDDQTVNWRLDDVPGRRSPPMRPDARCAASGST